jgi:single-stranded DNA-binding protein
MIGRLTLVGIVRAAPELRTTVSGAPGCHLQLTVNDWVKDRGSGVWHKHSHCFAIEVASSAARRCLAEITAGDQITVSGRLFWRQRPGNDNVQRKVSVLVADHVQFSRAAAGESLAGAVSPISDASASAGVLDDAG